MIVSLRECAVPDAVILQKLQKRFALTAEKAGSVSAGSAGLTCQIVCRYNDCARRNPARFYRAVPLRGDYTSSCGLWRKCRLRRRFLPFARSIMGIVEKRPEPGPGQNRNAENTAGKEVNMNRENDLPGRRRLAWSRQGCIGGNWNGRKKTGRGFVSPARKRGWTICFMRRTGTAIFVWQDYGYLCLEPEVLEEHSMCFQLSFYESRQEPPERKERSEAGEGKEEEEAGHAHHIRTASGIRTLVPFDFRILSSQVIFPERTPGRLKMSIFGKPVRLAEVKEIRLQTARAFGPFTFPQRNVS